jgi:hypothetical protein
VNASKILDYFLIQGNDIVEGASCNCDKVPDWYSKNFGVSGTIFKYSPRWRHKYALSAGGPEDYGDTKFLQSTKYADSFVDDRNATKNSLENLWSKTTDISLKRAIIESASWGSGQVLGKSLLDLYSNNPDDAWNAFWQTGETYDVDRGRDLSQNLIERWLDDNSGKQVSSTQFGKLTFKEAANANPPNFCAMAWKYNGPANTRNYTPKLQKAWEDLEPYCDADGNFK